MSYLILPLGLAALVAGMLVYSRFLPRIFTPFKSTTPAVTHADGHDFVAMPKWKNQMIQLLNIAGTGPIFGALMGAKWGPVVFLWIIFGTILGGAVHDYMSGMMSVREDGHSITSIITRYLGSWSRFPFHILVVFLMIMVSATFARSASDLLMDITGLPVWIWMMFILAYFLLSTILPINQVIGRLYPVFGVLLISMAVIVIGGLLFGGYAFPDMTLDNLHPDGDQFLPDMFITVACGAISGFHATQSPMVARCLKSEKEGFSVFYGAMVIESVIALIWATAGLAFYGGTDLLSDALADGGGSGVVHDIASNVAGPVGGVLAVIGVIICPITSGDTALRAARMMIQDDHGFDRSDRKLSVGIALVMLLLVAALCMMDFSVLWEYFSWLNQTLATIVLWTATAFVLVRCRNKWYSLVTALPAAFMTLVVSSFIMHSHLGLSIGYELSIAIGVMMAVVAFAFYLRKFINTPMGMLAERLQRIVSYPKCCNLNTRELTIGYE